MPEKEPEMGKKRTHSQDEGPREGTASGIPFEFMGMDRILNDWASAMDPAHLNKQWKTSPPVDFDLLLTSHRRNLETIRQAQQTASELVKTWPTSAITTYEPLLMNWAPRLAVLLHSHQPPPRP